MRFAKLLICISIIGTAFTAFSQKVTFSANQKIKNRIVYTDVLGEYKYAFYIVRFNKKSNQTFLIERYSNGLRMANQYEFRVDKEINVDKVLLVNGKVMIFYSEYDKKEKQYNLYCHVLNDKLSLIKKEKFITATKVKPSNKRIYRVSQDKYTGKILVFYPKEINKEIVYYNVLVLTDELMLVYDEQINIAPEKEYLLEELHLTDNAIAIIFSSRYGEKLRNRRKFYSLLYYNLEKKEKRIVDLFSDTMRFDNFYFKYNRLERSYAITGFYSGLTEDVLNGIAYANIDLETNKGDFQYLSFTQEMVKRIMGRSKNYGGLKDYFPKELVLRSDGGIILVSEYFDIQKELYSDYYNINHSYVKYFYKYSDVVVFSIDPDGTLDWYKILRKDQVTMNDDGYYSSFITGISKDQLVILYNDISRSKWNMISDKLNPEGETENKILVKDIDFDGYLIPKIGKQVSSNEIIIPGFGRKKGFVLLKVTL